MTNGVYLLLGSNLGDRMANMTAALDLIQIDAGAIVAQSHLYETAAWGIHNQGAFLNQVVDIQTSLSPLELLTVLISIEKTVGRKRTVKWGERLIDIDILYYNNLQINEPDLNIPHPYIPQRRFTLVPLCEIAPQFEHPVLKISQLELLLQCPDELDVNIYQP